ncbi:hypothetical protein DFH06DRAFT_1433 [Mycena polygramma]|nr:hypothetical protein DFH06DRAFT_1433 [Mycena polygramma]
MSRGGHLDCSTELSNLRLNVVPECTDCVAIRASIVEANEALALSAEQDASKAAEQSRANGESDEIHRYIAMASSRLAPIRRLPPETLSMIFLLLIFDYTLVIGQQRQHPVALVSFHWRAIALSIPSLWNRFSLSLRGSDGAFQMLQLCLRRSRRYPLTIEIRHDSDLQRPLHHGMVDHLTQNSERWLRITFPLNHPLLSLFAPIRGRLLSLEVASFSRPSGDSYNSSDAILETVDIFEVAPKLRSLSLRNAGDHFPLFPLKQLDRALFTRLHNEGVILTIRNSPNLRSLTCRWDSVHGRLRPYIGAPILLDSLETVSFSGDYSIFEHLTAPSLKSVSLTVMQNFSGSMVVAAMITRSQCSLHSLVLDQIWIHGNCLLEILHVTPTLHTLTIADGKPNSVTDKAMDALIMNRSGTVVLPALRNLTVRGSYLFRTSTLLDMLESRIAEPTRVQVVDLRLGHRQFTEADLERFRALREAAVELSLVRMDSANVCVSVI